MKTIYLIIEEDEEREESEEESVVVRNEKYNAQCIMKMTTMKKTSQA